jgi:hypothetical protein
VCKGSVGKINGNLLFRYILFGMFNGLGIALDGGVESVGFESLIALSFEFLAFF